MNDDLSHPEREMTEGVVTTSDEANINVSWTLGDLFQAIGLIVLLVLSAIVSISFARSFLENSERLIGLATLAASNMAQGGMLFAVWFFAIRRRSSSWSQLGLRAMPLGRLLRIVVMALAVAIVIPIVYTTVVRLMGLFELEPAAPPQSLINDPITFTILAVLAILVAPPIEEIFFRGFVFPALRGRLGTWGAAAASSLIFGLAHIAPGTVIVTMLLGLLLVYLYVYTGSLWASILVHTSFNAFNIGLLVLTS